MHTRSRKGIALLLTAALLSAALLGVLSGVTTVSAAPDDGGRVPYRFHLETLRDAAESLDAEDELNAILEKYGCTSAVGLGSLTALLTVAAAAYALKKK